MNKSKEPCRGRKREIKNVSIKRMHVSYKWKEPCRGRKREIKNVSFKRMYVQALFLPRQGSFSFITIEYRTAYCSVCIPYTQIYISICRYIYVYTYVYIQFFYMYLHIHIYINADWNAPIGWLWLVGSFKL